MGQALAERQTTLRDVSSVQPAMSNRVDLVPDGVAHRSSLSRRGPLGWYVLTAVALGLAAAGYSQRALLSQVPPALTHVRDGWLLLTATCTLVSIPALALQQRQLISVGGRRLRIPAVVATTFAGNAISVTVPVIGSELSLAYSYRRFAAAGVDRAVLVWSFVVSGVVSSTMFAILVAAGASVSGDGQLALAGLIGLAGVVAPAILLLLGLRLPAVRRQVVRALASIERRLSWLRPKSRSDWDQLIGKLLTLHPRNRTLGAASFLSLLNWTSDIACLAFALKAVGAPVPWHALVLSWALGSGVASLGLTPAGLGVVEAALTVALVGAGVPHVLALSGVLVYRFFSLWVALAIGWATIALGGGQRPGRPVEADLLSDLVALPGRSGAQAGLPSPFGGVS